MIKVAIALDGGNQNRILLPQVLFQTFQSLFNGFSCAGHHGFLQISSGMVPGIVCFVISTNISESNKFTAETTGTQSVK
jgi:hypothetical protein